MLDGRNRRAACAKADIEPSFTFVSLDDEEATAFVLSANIHRRHMTKGQRAMAVAMIYPKRIPRGKGSETEHFSKALLSNARAVLEHAPGLAAGVLAGASLSDAHDEALRRKKADASDESQG